MRHFRGIQRRRVKSKRMRDQLPRVTEINPKKNKTERPKEGVIILSKHKNPHCFSIQHYVLGTNPSFKVSVNFRDLTDLTFMEQGSRCLSFAPCSMLYVFGLWLSLLSGKCCQTQCYGFLGKLSLHLPSYFNSDLFGRESCENHPFAIWYQLQIAS